MFLPDGFGRFRNRVRSLPSTPTGRLRGLLGRPLLSLFFRLLSGGLPLLDIFLDLSDILFGGLYSLTALLIKLVDSFMAHTIHTE